MSKGQLDIGLDSSKESKSQRDIEIVRIRVVADVTLGGQGE